MEIFKWEIQKIWRRRSTKIVIIIAVAYVIFSAVYTGVFSLGSARNRALEITQTVCKELRSSMNTQTASAAN